MNPINRETIQRLGLQLTDRIKEKVSVKVQVGQNKISDRNP